jgi:class 3 adenylate cyclase
MAEAQPARVRRRLAAIVAADVAGYSRLVGLDAVGTAPTRRERCAITDALAAKHGGRMVKTMGDGVLLEFPLVVDAVEYEWDLFQNDPVRRSARATKAQVAIGSHSLIMTASHHGRPATDRRRLSPARLLNWRLFHAATARIGADLRQRFIL